MNNYVLRNSTFNILEAFFNTFSRDLAQLAELAQTVQPAQLDEPRREELPEGFLYTAVRLVGDCLVRLS